RRPDVPPVIRVSCEDEGSHWRVSVSDNGMGVDPDFADQIFEPFRRLHTWDSIKGTGLGLAIGRKIADSHGGRIWVESVRGEGSTFHFTLSKTLATQ
ncbi:MAG: sensor histidine kinase, partial [Asticcacaulis sp.]